MQFVRPVIASDPRTFGRGMQRAITDRAVRRSTSDELKLFATTFLAGFMFMSVFLA
jgi:hypothetical protein